MNDGTIVYSPHPNGAKRPGFNLTHYHAKEKRAVFENTAHDFPQRFTFAQPTPDALTITLTGPGKDGAEKQVVFALRRVPK